MNLLLYLVYGRDTMFDMQNLKAFKSLMVVSNGGITPFAISYFLIPKKSISRSNVHLALSLIILLLELHAV